MSPIAVEVNHVYKKFRRGEFHDSLRDLVPALARRVLGRGPRRDELEQDDFWALNDVSFQVRRGEVLGIIGANGAGKSTLLKILSKILKPTRGSIRTNGRLRALIEVAAGFHGDLTGRENVYLNGSILGMKKREIDAKFDEIVEFPGIGSFLDTPVKRYSSGMFARLGFAVAAHLDPEVLIVDEVLAVGDATFQKKSLGKMNSVAKAGRTVLFVSHNMQAVTTLCTRAILLVDGRQVLEGDPRSVVEYYLAGGSDEMVETAERTWPRDSGPGDEVVRLSAMRVVDEDGAVNHHHDIAKPVTLEMDFWLFRPHPDISCSMHVYNQDDLCLFVGGTPIRPQENGLVAPGLYRARFHIPANFLNDGLHSMSAFAIQNTTQWAANAQRAVSFRVHEYQREGGYVGKIIGAVRPKLPWTTMRLRDL